MLGAHFRPDAAVVFLADPDAGKVLAGAYRADRAREVRLPMVEVSTELAAWLDEEIERRTQPVLRRA